MRFFVHGTVTPEAQQALVRHGHGVHTALELSEETDAPAALEGSPAEFLALLAKRQWHLFTTDTEFIRRMYEEKAEFPGGVIVLLLDRPEELHDQAPAVDRLFERYKRLTAKRMYTITPTKVKVRQLPGRE